MLIVDKRCYDKFPVLQIDRKCKQVKTVRWKFYLQTAWGKVAISNTENQWRQEGGLRGASAPGGTEEGRHLEGRKYGILKFGRFWQIAICIADSDILHPLIPPNTCLLYTSPSPRD